MNYYLLRIFALVFGLSLIYSLLTSSSGGRATVANTGNTGAPSEATTCSGCHSGGAFGTVTMNIGVFQVGTNTPVTSYVGGTTYDMKVTVQFTSGTPGGYGFQMTCLTSPANTPLAGYSSLAANVKQKTISSGPFNGRTYVEQNGVMNNPIFAFQWTAPASGTGTVKFYAAGNAVNATGSSSGDKSGTGSFTLPEATAPLAVTGNATNVICNGASTGAIDITASGGTPPYTYNWGGGITTEDRTNIPAGTYTVVITDALGISTTASYTITQGTAIVPIANPSPIFCNGGTSTVVVSATGGTGPYTGTGTFTVNGGTQTFTVTDALGCSASTTINISQPNQLNVNANATNILCNGGTSTITVTATGGTAPYTGTGTFTVNAGIYSYTVTDANGCSSQTNVTVSQPAILSANANAGSILCNGGTTVVLVVGTGGTAPYSGTGSFVVGAGTYNYVVTDVNGCSATTPVSISEPTPLILATTTDTIDCFGDTAMIVITANGGTPPYSGTGTFMITNPGTYNYVVTDANNCSNNIDAVVISNSGLATNANTQNTSCDGICDGSITVNVVGGTAPYTYSWSNNATSPSLTGLCEGTYQQYVTDSAGCVLINSYTIVEPSAIVITTNTTSPILCFGDSATVLANVTGGTGTYTYDWGNGQTGNTATLPAGNYTLTVTDINGCIESLTNSINQPAQLNVVVDAIIDAPNNVNGAIQITVTGGIAPYTYSWSNGQTTQDLSGIPSGTYSVVITDANGCEMSISNLVVLQTVGIEDLLQSEIYVYPNPAVNSLFVNIPQGLSGKLGMSIYNAAGSLILNSLTPSTLGEINVSTLSTGSYILVLTYGDKQYKYPFVRN